MTLERLEGQPRIEDLFRAKQDEMEAVLSANRRVMPHEGEKGAAAELRWRKMLTAYLPQRYSVRSGFVVDHHGNISEQIDTIIHDAQYSPFLFHAGTSCFVPAESIYAVLDAKQEMNKRTLSETGDKVASVRRLDRTSGRVWKVDGCHPGKNPDDQPILGGILAVSSGWTESFGDSFRAAHDELTDEKRLDLGVAIEAGAFERGIGDEQEVLVYEHDTALVGFFMALIRQLQPLATALAMDLEVWGRPLRREG